MRTAPKTVIEAAGPRTAERPRARVPAGRAANRRDAARAVTVAMLGAGFAVGASGCGASPAPGANVGTPCIAAPLLSAPATAPAATAPPTADEARAFVDDVEANLRRLWVARDRASWTSENFITDDTDALAAAGEEATAAYVGEAIERARRFDPIRASLPPDVARKLYLLSIAQTIPAPRDEKEREELASIETWMTSTYGKGQYCPGPGSPLAKYVKVAPRNPHQSVNAGAGGAGPANGGGAIGAGASNGGGPGPANGGGPGPANGGGRGGAGANASSKAGCLHLDELSSILRKSRDFAELVEAWRGWHTISVPMKERFTRYVTLANEGAREIGFADVGAMWRSGYDMTPADLEADVERLWREVEPLYDELHCYVRSKLQAKYGKARVPDHAPIPSELLGNMWAQEWGNVFDLVVPYPGEPVVDVTRELEAQRWDAQKMVRQGERFFTGLGFDPLPATFWERSLFVRPRDREVVCHASAWDVTWSDDLRIKMCIEPTDEDFVTIHHELGHDFYFQRYFKLPILFQQGANDGFHEAIGDTMALSVTPAYLASIGLRRGAPALTSEKARVNQQMRMALDKVAFLPFGLLIDKWRWDVFSGKTAPADYNASWWRLKEHYQGVSAPLPRAPDDFDPGAKFHVASSTPYLRYFLARIYQFQFHKALCRAAGFTGPLDQCSIHDDKRAGEKLIAMLSMGASRPWPDAMEALGAGRKGDAGPLLEYFAPLKQWLDAATKGQTCGWSAPVSRDAPVSGDAAGDPRALLASGALEGAMP